MSVVTRITLLERVRTSSDDEAWRQFNNLYDALIMHWLLGQGVDHNDAYDVRQEVMATIHREIGQFEHNGRPGAFRNWLRQITSNRMRRLWQEKKHKGTDDSGGADLGMMSQELSDNKSRMTLMWDAQHNQFIVNQLLAQLSSRFSEQHVAAFRRIVLEDEAPQSVADDFNMTLGAVRVAQHRVLRALKEMGQGLID